MTKRRENIENINDEVTIIEETPAIKKAVELIALQTIGVYCNKPFKLIKGQNIPKDLPKEFYTSLINSKIIKEV